MRFNYQAKTKTNEIQTGIVEASDKNAAVALLQERGLFITALEEEAVAFYAKQVKIFQRITKKDIVNFSRELSIMLKSKVPIVEVLGTLADESKNAELREKILNIAEDVEGGTTLSKSLASHPRLFNPFYVSMVRAGEALGRLAEAFEYLADYVEREYNFSSKIKGAMLYPLLVLFTFIIVMAIMIVFVVPQLSILLKETGQDLPLITKLVMWGAEFIKKWILAILIIFVVLIVFIFRYFKTEKGKKFYDETIIILPLLGPFVRKIYLARLASNLSTLISGGIPIAQALEITSETVANSVYRDIILATSEEVKKGEAISAVLKRYPEAIPPFFIQLTVVGEKTGTVDASLMSIVDFYQKEIDRTLDNLVNLIGPLMILVLGGLVAGLMIAILLPIYQGISAF